MTDQDILERLTAIFRDVLDDECISLTRSTTSEDLRDWDSANHINIVVSAEMRFNLKFSSAEVERLENVGDFIDLIKRKIHR